MNKAELASMVLSGSSMAEVCRRFDVLPAAVTEACRDESVASPPSSSVTEELCEYIITERAQETSRAIAVSMGLRARTIGLIVSGSHKKTPDAYRGRSDLGREYVCHVFTSDPMICVGAVHVGIRSREIRGEVTQRSIPQHQRGRCALIHDEAISRGFEGNRDPDDVQALADEAECSYLDVLLAMAGRFDFVERADSLAPTDDDRSISEESLMLYYDAWVSETEDQWMEYEDWRECGIAREVSDDKRLPRRQGHAMRDTIVPGYRADDRGMIVNAAGQTLATHIRGDRACVRIIPETYTIDELVCAAWHGIAPPGRPFVGHLNGQVRDSRPKNLAWCDRISKDVLHG